MGQRCFPEIYFWIQTYLLVVIHVDVHSLPDSLVLANSVISFIGWDTE